MSMRNNYFTYVTPIYYNVRDTEELPSLVPEEDQAVSYNKILILPRVTHNRPKKRVFRVPVT